MVPNAVTSSGPNAVAAAGADYAQGYLFADNDTTPDGSENAAVQVVLNTNLPASSASTNAPGLVDAAMWDRVAGTVVGNSPSTTAGAEASNAAEPLANTRTNPTSDGSTTAELNFCEQGVPAAGLGIYKSKNNPGADSKTTAAQVGDPDCNGYAVHWVYSTSSATCDVATENAPAPLANTFPAPTADQPNTGAQNIVASWGCTVKSTLVRSWLTIWRPGRRMRRRLPPVTRTRKLHLTAVSVPDVPAPPTTVCSIAPRL